MSEMLKQLLRRFLKHEDGFIFTAPRYASARSLLSPGICPSVRLSRWCIVSTRLKISSKFFLGPVAYHSIFSTLSTGTQFQGEPLQQRGRQNTRGVWKFAIFASNHRLFWKRYEIGPELLRKLIGTRRRWIDPCRFWWWPWVTSNPDFKVTVYLQVEYLKNGAF